MKRAAPKIVPTLLNFELKQCRMNIAQEMLTPFNSDRDLPKKVITGDESWVYGYDIETKDQSFQWKRPEEPRPKKAHKVWSKVLLTIFFDCNSVVVDNEFWPQGSAVNKEYYLEIMCRLHEAICQKRIALWKKNTFSSW